MSKPFIFCHMNVSLDGKIVGNYSQTEINKESSTIFYNLAFGKNAFYEHQGWLSGRTTTDDNFTHYKTPQIDEDADIVPEGDFVIKTKLEKYYVSIDPHGKLAWESYVLNYQKTKAHVIEVITNQVSNGYKAMLRKLNIPYIIAGDNQIDYEQVVNKLNELFGIETLMLGGGGVLNWSLIQAGLCDEVSLIVSPVADGSSETPSVFETKQGLSTDSPVTFSLINAEPQSNGSIWLRYKVNNDK